MGRLWGAAMADPIFALLYALLGAGLAGSAWPLPSELHHRHPLYTAGRTSIVFRSSIQAIASLCKELAVVTQTNA